LKNVTKLLALRIMDGTPAEVTADLRENLKPQRDPKPHNGHAKDLFASDLLALKTGALSLDFEEKEKELLRISEAFDIRGPEIDSLHEAHLEIERDKTAHQALGSLEGYVMTVFDGAFPLDYLKQHDLTVSKFAMAARENTRLNYDAKNDGPGYDPGGIRWEAP